MHFIHMILWMEQTVRLYLGKKTQKEAAVQAVKKIGLNQISEIPKGIFGLLPEYKGMFERRYGLLREL